MNAIKFIREVGIEKAREFIDAKSYTLDQLLMLQLCGLNLKELESIFESVDYVNIHGYAKSREILANAPKEAECYSWTLGGSGVRDKTVNLKKLEQAIAVVESIYE